MILFIILLIVGIYLLYKIKKFKYPNIILCTGAVKAGKSTLCVHLVRKLYKRKLIKYHIKKLFKKKCEKPLIYSNIPLKMKNVVVLKQEHIMRNARFNYDSVIYICESTLVADSMAFKDMDMNARLTLFNKLIAHELHGGYLIYDTQCAYDNHYSIKRCVDRYVHVDTTYKFLPFILIAKVQEREMTEGERVTMVEDVDAETIKKRYKWFIFSKSVWKCFDRYCYSYATDGLPVINEPFEPKQTKAKKVISFNKYIKEGYEDEI